MDKDKSDGCCKDEFLRIRLQDHQPALASFLLAPLSLPAGFPPSDFFFVLPIRYQRIFKALNAHPPPGFSKQKLHLIYCLLLI
jgi:hypothetical protein